MDLLQPLAPHRGTSHLRASPHGMGVRGLRGVPFSDTVAKAEALLPAWVMAPQQGQPCP